ncbi:MAG: hydrogenase nickel incorporation protein HypB [Kiritimatiellae bacterium]|jgi:hydrogenase nickel incorporation protein HypB|nr:hydrogenase nickel incorporation protein HypB [Kiritimatiellia bacterium]
MTFKVIKENILKANDNVALRIRQKMTQEKTLMINIISSPGAGKTALLEKIGPMLKEEGINFIILIGDCFTSRDAERMDALDLPVVQINTGNSCHIDAQLIEKSLEDVDVSAQDIIIVENVGNLVCPAEFDLGENHKIALFSTAEGDDKPLKYPLVIQESVLAIINKIDLLEYVNFDMEFSKQSIKQINPNIEILEMSCKTGQGIDKFVQWIKNNITKKEKKV